MPSSNQEVLSLRFNEVLTYYPDYQSASKSGDRVYLVRLLETPSLPLMSPDCKQLAVICAADYGDAYGWVYLDPETKLQVGEHLETIHRHIPVDPLEQWVYMTVTEKTKLHPSK